ncbi:hypothetical protein [Nocardia grenadensis]|uniref:hypothetical protein n=1 Tax=Nocardia grenadensis TaxID=931537 RepID=UPI003D8FF72A
MTESTFSRGDDWPRLRGEAAVAVKELLEQLEAGESAQDTFDAYLRAKSLAADAMQARMRQYLPERCGTFHDLRERLGTEIVRRYRDVIPEKYLRVPYGSRTHEELFGVLFDDKGAPVPAARLRIVTADSVHTERRTRELRELGLDIDATKANGEDVYTLKSLEIDIEKIRSIVRKNMEKDKGIPADERQRYLDAIEH